MPNELFRIADPRQDLVQGPQLVFAEVAQASLVLPGDQTFELIEQTTPPFGDARGDQAPILGITTSNDESHLLHSIEEPSDVRHASQHSVSQLIATQPFWL